MKFSLVLATLGRTTEVGRFVASLETQGHRDFELIVIDQNPDDRLVPILAPYVDRFPVLHLRSERGLSRARNVGLAHVSGDIVAFPDDDCWYPIDLLAFVNRQLAATDWDGLTGRQIDENGVDTAFTFDRQSTPLDRFNVWNRAISSTIFLRRETVDAIGPFDETLGVGANTIFGSGEETDYVLRALDLGKQILYMVDLCIHHPNPEEQIDDRLIRRTYAYGCGMGRVLTKHQYPAWFKLRSLLRPFAGALLALGGLRRAKAALHWNKCRGRLRGLRAT